MEKTNHKTKIIAISGGKGGVGKTFTSVNIACLLAKLKQRVLLLDADFGLSNIDVVLNLKPKSTLLDLVEGRAELADIIHQGPIGVDIIPGASGIVKLANLSLSESFGILSSLNNLSHNYDYLIIDTAAGISEQLITINAFADEVIMVVLDDPASITDAYAMIKLLSAQHNVFNFQVVINRATHFSHAQKIFAKLNNVANKHLDVLLHFLGWVKEDPVVSQALKERKPLIELYPSSLSAICMKDLTQKLMTLPHRQGDTGEMQFFTDIFVSKPYESANL